MKPACFIGNVSQDNFTVGPEELIDVSITQFFLIFVATTVAVSPSLGMVTAFKGVTVDRSY